MPFAVPASLMERAHLSPVWARWLDELPRLVADLIAEWELEVTGDTRHGECAVVLPVVTADGEPAMLKVGLPDPEHEHEALGLQRWGGDGAVRLLRADPHRFALLLERLHDQDLGELWDLEACEIVAGLYARLHIPAPPQLRPLTAYVATWSRQLADLPRDAPIPRRMVDLAVSLAKELSADDPGRMLHTDLHFENVLAADREPWLAIDPKPVSGDPHYEVAPLLWNRWDELEGDVRRGVRARFHAVVDATGFDEDRARGWVIVRMMHNALWAIEDGDTGEWLTRCISIAKAVQD